MMNAVESLFFREKFLVDDREPIFTFTVPPFFDDGNGSTYGILPVNFHFWYQATLLLLVQSALSVVVAILTYKYVLPRRRSPSSRLVTFGILIPLVLYAPFHLARELHLRNRGILFTLNNVSTVTVFRLLEASFGTSANGAEDSLRNYCLYCATVAGVVFDSHSSSDADDRRRRKISSNGSREADDAARRGEKKKTATTKKAPTITASRGEGGATGDCGKGRAGTGTGTTTTTIRGRAVRRLTRALIEYAVMGILLSAGRRRRRGVSLSDGDGGGGEEEGSKYEPFPSHGVDCASFDHGWADLLHWGHLLNNAYAALTFFLIMSFSLTLMSAAVSLLTGYETIDSMKDPLFSSTSPSEFWGERWNRNVQSMLKRAIYKPLRKSGHPAAMSAAATFLASGVLHEFCWLVLFFRHDDCSTPGTCFEHVRGTHVAFFGYNGLIVGMEFLGAGGGLWIFRAVRRSLPPVAVASTVVLAALPVSHWFTGSLIKGDFFEHVSFAAPIVVKLPS